MVEGRSTVYNQIRTPELLGKVCKENLQLEEDFLYYLQSIDRSKKTIQQYKNNIEIFWCWNVKYNLNKSFIVKKKRDLVRFQQHAIRDWGWSSARIRAVRSSLASLERYISNILDDEYPDFKPIVNKIEPPPLKSVREKAIFTMSDLQPLLNLLVEKGEYEKACVLALAMYSGRRKAELTRFKVSYFDKSNIICHGALFKSPERIVTKGRGSEGKLLYVYTLRKPFQNYLNLWLNERKRLGIKSDWLFPKRVNGKYIDEPITPEHMDTYARYFSKLLGKHFYFHSIRHLFTTYLLEANLPESVVQDIQGWESIDMVRIYDDRDKDEELEKYFDENGIKPTTFTPVSNL